MSVRCGRKSHLWVTTRSDGGGRCGPENTPPKGAAPTQCEGRVQSTDGKESAEKLSVHMIVSAFCRDLKMRCPHKSYKNDVSRLRAFFGQICEELKPGRPEGAATKSYPDKFAHAHVKAEFLEDVSPAIINRFISDRMREDAWSPKTANDFREVLHRLFAFAIKQCGYCSRDRRYPNPVAAVERRREPAPQIRFLTLGQIEEQLRILENYPVIRALVATYIYAGLCREEALWLTREDVDLERKMMRVQAKTIEGRTWQPKTRRNRAIPISARLLGILHEYGPPQECPWFFPSPKGKRWHPDNFSQDLRAINKANGLDWGCLDFRHTFGSQLAQKGESLFKISTLMGNSPAICQRHYAALIPETMHDTVEFPVKIAKAAPLNGAGDTATKELMNRLLCEVRALRRSMALNYQDGTSNEDPLLGG